MKIALTLDVDRNVAPVLTMADLRDDINMVLSAVLDGHPKGTAIHPGLLIDWRVENDDDAMVIA